MIIFCRCLDIIISILIIFVNISLLNDYSVEFKIKEILCAKIIVLVMG